MTRKTNSHGDKKDLFPTKKKRINKKAINKTKAESFIEWRRKQTELSMSTRQSDDQTVNWGAFGRDNVKLYHNPITKQNIKRKYYKRFSKS